MLFKHVSGARTGPDGPLALIPIQNQKLKPPRALEMPVPGRNGAKSVWESSGNTHPTQTLRPCTGRIFSTLYSQGSGVRA